MANHHIINHIEHELKQSFNTSDSIFKKIQTLMIELIKNNKIYRNHKSNYSDGLLMGILASNMSRPKNRRRYCE